MRLGLILSVLLLIPCVLLSAEPKQEYPSLPPPREPARLGLHIQRTMRLLATSTPRHRNRVRILFYGQSITEQDWWKQVADDLRKRFPHADLDIQNRAIGGFASQLLIRPAEHDLYPFYPDLLIFHVYGSNKEYEDIIRSTRSRTTAEVLMQTDHLTRWPPKTIDRERDKGAWWDDLMNHHLLPDIARKYGCGLADVRSSWHDYLERNHLEPKALLKDDVHLNDHGCSVMARIIERNLVYRPDLPADPGPEPVRTLVVGKDLHWQDGLLRLEFEGNRIDVLSARRPGAAARAAEVRIDGKKPSSFPGSYCITRPQPGPWSPLALTRVDHDRPLVVEDWTLEVTSLGDGSKTWEFDVKGSRTGEDGHGRSDRPFVSKSGRVKIEPGAWFRHGDVPKGTRIHWQVKPLFVDHLEPAVVEDSAREYPTTLAQGLANTKHTLEILAPREGRPEVAAIRVYRPPVTK